MRQIRLLIKIITILACSVCVKSLYCQSVNNASSLMEEGRFSLSSHELEFIENKGQLADQYGKPMPEVLYSSDAKGMKCYLTSKGMHFIFSRSIPSVGWTLSPPISAGGLRVRPTGKDDTLILQRLDMEFAGANPHPRIEAQKISDDYFNYYLAYCKLTGIRGYRKIIYHDLYPHIDFLIYSKGSRVKYDFVVHPGGNPNVIAMRYNGMDSMRFSDDGRFKIYTPLGKMEEDEPYTYQENDGLLVIPSHFLLTDNEVHFRIGNYDRTRDLVIDPVRRMWGTYYGGRGEDAIISTVVDKGNNIFVCGYTLSTSGIATTGSYQSASSANGDAFLAAFSPTGQRLWATYYGGDGGEDGYGIAIDSSGTLAISGLTTSTGMATAGAFQTSRSGFGDLFVATFTNSGALKWATYYSSNLGAWSFAYNNICFDRKGNLFLCGATYGTTGLGTPGAYQTSTGKIQSYYSGFLVKFSPSGSRLWGTFFAGDQQDISTAVATDPLGNIIMSGFTGSTTGIATSGAFQTANGGGGYDGFISKFSASGAMQWSTYYGGNFGDEIYSICTDSAGNIYAAGNTLSTTGIATPGAYQPALNGGGDGFIVKFNPAGIRQWGTYYGGEGNESCLDIATNFSELLISGGTSSKTGITTTDAYQLFHGNGTNAAYLSKFSLSGSLKWGTYYDGYQYDYGLGCTIDHAGNMILVGATLSAIGIASPGSFKDTIDLSGANNGDGFIVKFCNVIPPVLGIPKKTLCANSSDTITLNSGYSHVYWYDDTTALPSLTDSLRFILPDTLPSGRHRISVEVVNASDCIGNDTVSLLISSGPVLHIVQDTFVCAGNSIQIGGNASGGIPPYTYKWLSVLGLSSTTIATPIATAKKTTVYTVIVTDSIGCQIVDSVTVHVLALPVPSISGLTSVCPQTDAGYVAKGNATDTYHWTLSGGGMLQLSSRSDSVDVLWTTVGKWKLTVSRTNAQGCTGDTTFTVNVSPILTPQVMPGGNITICEGDSIILHADKGYAKYSWSDGSTNDSIVIKKGGIFTVSVIDNNGCTGTSGTISVTVVPIPVITIAPDAAIHICEGSVVHLTATGDPGQYLWSTGDTSLVITISKPGTYSVQVRNASGCLGTSQPVTVTKDSAFHPIIIGPITICQGQGSVNYSILNDSGAAYKWTVTNGSIINGQGTNGVSIQWNDAALGTGSLMVIETTAGGCLDTGFISITIDANLHPVISALGALPFCQGDSVTLDAGSGYVSYQWSKDATLLSGATNEFLRVGQSGSYSVTVTNSSGCVGTSQPIIITVFPLPAQPIITRIGDTLICSSAATYQWFLDGQLLPGETNQKIIISKTGKYTVQVTDANGCTNTSVPIAMGVKATAIVRVGQVPMADPGIKLEIPIELVASQNLIPANANHYIGTLRYNGTMLIPTGSRNGTLQLSAGVPSSTDRTISFEGFSAPMTVGTLQWIQAIAMLGIDSCTRLAIDTFYWTDADVDVTRENGSFCESGLCYAGGQLRLLNPTGKFGMSPVRPNPASSHIRIEYDLVETGRTELALVDLIGRKNKIILTQEQKPGHYSVDTSVQDISSGYYQLTLKTPSQFLRQSFVIQK